MGAFNTFENNCLKGNRFELRQGDEDFPQALKNIPNPPKCLRLIGNPCALQEGLAIVGARKATPYGISAAKHFARLAAEKGIVIISGGARGCDSASHRAALECGGMTVAFLGGGCDEVYPPENFALFQEIIDRGGAVVSEQDWTFKPLKHTFRERNRLIAGLARATLIVEAGLPSGTFTTADAALEANREVLAVPGSISSPQSLGANRLIYQGATPVVDDDTFYDQLFSLYGCMLQEDLIATSAKPEYLEEGKPILEAIEAQPLGIEALHNLVCSSRKEHNSITWLTVWLAKACRDGFVAQYPDGRYGPVAAMR